MPRDYSVQTCRALEELFRAADVARPLGTQRYDAGTELAYAVEGVWPVRRAQVRLRVDQYVGGGYAGQVYRVVVLSVEGEPVEGLTAGGTYALKIIIPPSSFRRRFRDAVYRAGFAAPFSPQVLPDALRAGSLWQKFIRRAAQARFGDDQAVADVLATLTDQRIGSCGEIRQWVEGRQWRFEVDDRVDARWRWRPGRGDDRLGSPEYRAKRTFMRGLVDLMHRMGAPELARQYEWWTCKSQPNVLKRPETETDPAAGLTAVDFRAGLALLPVLPMSPGDVKLILAGLARGSLVQFDRGNVEKLRRYVGEHPGEFDDMAGAVEELARLERQYRDSLPDPAHHHVRLLYDRSLWAGILDGAVTGWRVANVIDEPAAGRLRRSRLLAVAFAVLGMLPVLGLAAAVALLAWAWAGKWLGLWQAVAAGGLAIVLPTLARFARKVAGRRDLRTHYRLLLTRPGYLARALRAHVAERLISWHRAGRVGPERALLLARQPWRYLLHRPLAVLPAGLHRFLTDRRFAWSAVKFVVTRPLALLFDPAVREKWLSDMVADGVRHGMLTDAEAARILGQIKEPFIQKYLKCLAVHVCTLPVTQLVSVPLGIYLAWRYGKTAWEGLKIAGSIIVALQVVPVSPGSFVRGAYVVYLVLRERNFRDYNIAVFLGFFKYVGYLAFPVQMAYRYPALARFMAGHWATGAVRIVPVFGEHGALLEHAVFDLFYNYLLTLRRRILLRQQARAGRPARLWHAAACALAAVAMLAGMDALWQHRTGYVPTLRHTWYLAFWPVLAAGWAAAAWAGGLSTARRVLLGLAAGAAVAFLSAAANAVLAAAYSTDPAAVRYVGRFATILVWRLLYFALPALLGALVAETRPVRPDRPTAG